MILKSSRSLAPFGENFIVNTGDQIFKLGLQSTDAKAKITAQIFKGITDIVKIGVGHSLHQFSTGTISDDRSQLEAQLKDYNAATDFNYKDNGRDAFEAEPPPKGLTWDDVAGARDMADVLMAEAQVEEAAKKAKKEGGGFFWRALWWGQEEGEGEVREGFEAFDVYDEDEYQAKTSAPGKRT